MKKAGPPSARNVTRNAPMKRVAQLSSVQRNEVCAAVRLSLGCNSGWWERSVWARQDVGGSSGIPLIRKMRE
jgi:hypothetical protein